MFLLFLILINEKTYEDICNIFNKIIAWSYISSGAKIKFQRNFKETFHVEIDDFLRNIRPAGQNVLRRFKDETVQKSIKVRNNNILGQYPHGCGQP